MATRKLERTTTPGILRRHAKECDRRGRCECAYVVVWRHRGRQHTATFRTFAEAREAKGKRDAGERRPASRQPFAEYARHWLETYRGRTSRGLSESTRRTYRRDMERWVIPRFGGFKLADVEPPDVREFVAYLCGEGLRPSSVRAIVAPLKAMYATAVEDGAVPVNPTREVRIGAMRGDQATDQGPARAMTRADLARMLGCVPERWRLLLELLAHTGLRISELAGAGVAGRRVRRTPAPPCAPSGLPRRGPGIEVRTLAAGDPALAGDGAAAVRHPARPLRNLSRVH
jgi:integrase